MPPTGNRGWVWVSLEKLSKRFKKFAEQECKGSSSLYEHLAMCISADLELLQLSAHAREGQPVPNLLFGAVHYLLLGGISHQLSEYYATIVENPRDPFQAFHDFKDFCIRYRSEIISILKNKLVQTNEVRRCAYLYPSFCQIYKIAQKSLALIEIGTSAGLQLLWDKYSYSYNDKSNMYGNQESELELSTEIRGKNIPLMLDHSPPVTSRIGLDLNINNLSNREDYLWLKALIWPEHQERIFQFEQAASYLKGQALELIEGDGVSLLPEIASEIPTDSSICVFHTHVANQLPREAKMLLLNHIKDIGSKREIYHLYNNMWDADLHLDYYIKGKEYSLILAKIDGHGRWFEWLL